MPKSSSQRPPAKQGILNVHDYPLMRRGLTRLINYEPDLIVCAEAATAQEGLEAIAVCRPDLVIADLFQGDENELDLVKAIRSGAEDLPILVLSIHDAPDHARGVFHAGANSFVSKQEMGEPGHSVPAPRRAVRKLDAQGCAWGDVAVSGVWGNPLSQKKEVPRFADRSIEVELPKFCEGCCSHVDPIVGRGTPGDPLR